MPEHAWDNEVDLLVVGSGAGGMTAALVAHDHGLEALVVEKSDRYGGSTAMSGGAIWVPCNQYMADCGIDDTPEEAIGYLSTITEGRVPRDRLEAYVRHAPEMVAYLTEKSRLRMQPAAAYADYFPEVPGGKPGARTLEPQHFDARLLGEEFYRMREPAPQTLLRGFLAFTMAESKVLLRRKPGWRRLMARLVARYLADVPARLRSKRDRNLGLGNALVGHMRMSLLDRGIPVWLETAAREVVEDESGRVVGIVAERDGRVVRIGARKGVVLAAGGFENDQQMREKFLPSPTSAEWSCGNPANTGDAIRMGTDIGVRLDFMDNAWWGPTTVVPGDVRARMLVIEKCLPGCVFVNHRGERFVNEATPYEELVHCLYAAHRPEAPCIPTYMVFDRTYRRKYPIGPILHAAVQPDLLVPARLRGTYLHRASTIPGLAAKIGVDAAGLGGTIAKMNEYARTGEDLDFHKGDSLYDRYYGDPTVEPNPCLGPIETPPFYAIAVYPGDIGTKGGLVTDPRARALTDSGDVVEGLYAIGNCSAPVMGPTYAGAGATIGPAMTFGYVAALDAAGAL